MDRIQHMAEKAAKYDLLQMTIKGHLKAYKEILSDVCIAKIEEISEPENYSSQKIDTPKEENVPQFQINALDNNELEYISKEMRNDCTITTNEEVHMIRA